MNEKERLNYWNRFMRLIAELDEMRSVIQRTAGIVQNDMKMTEELLENWKGISISGYDRMEMIFYPIHAEYDDLYVELCEKFSKELEEK